ncbi:hypothetical protein F9K98_23495 [Brucella anthropi]|uniref:ParB/RepB/Spo0J family partition protein n=1 Tax=Brucella anthropi TaxID=529 RepID=UPI00124D9E7C|nr:hypothetical protein [Brucella anthropi]KAB2757366.1 hypothetical protein F9K98_23495 [Brucella anthropi]
MAENVIRAHMHPADEFVAFAKQIESGKTVTDVAALFGVTETVVKKRMTLGKVAPAIIDAFRNDSISLAQVQAYALDDDHDRQMAIFAGNPNAASWKIRELLTEGEIQVSDRRVKLIGLENYVNAGGGIRRDLFARDDDESFLTDVALIDKLFAEKLTAWINEIKAEGWANVSVWEGQYYELTDSYRGRVYPHALPMTEAEEKRRDEIAAEMEALEVAEDSSENLERYEQLEQELEQLNKEAYSEADIAKSSAFILYSGGFWRVERGLFQIAKHGAVGDSATPKPMISAKLLEELEAVRCAIVAADLTSNPVVALAANVHAMACDLLMTYSSFKPAFDVRFSHSRLEAKIQNAAIRPLEFRNDGLKRVFSDLPKEPSEWLAHFLNMDVGALLDIMAVLTAHTVHGAGMAEKSRKIAVDDLAKHMSTTAEKWVTLSDLGYHERVSKGQLLKAIEEVHGKEKADNLSGLKKGELAKQAIDLLDGKWLPPELNELISEETKQSFRPSYSIIASLRDDAIDDDMDSIEDDEETEDFNDD